jgi:hypothetical protein
LDLFAGNTALIYSAVVGNDVAIDILTRHFRRLGLNIDHVNKDGSTALLAAAQQTYITCCSLLIGQGHASLNFKDKLRGFTVEDYLAESGFTIEDVAPQANGRGKFQRVANLAITCARERMQAIQTVQKQIAVTPGNTPSNTQSSGQETQSGPESTNRDNSKTSTCLSTGTLTTDITMDDQCSGSDDQMMAGETVTGDSASPVASTQTPELVKYNKNGSGRPCANNYVRSITSFSRGKSLPELGTTMKTFEMRQVVPQVDHASQTTQDDVEECVRASEQASGASGVHGVDRRATTNTTTTTTTTKDFTRPADVVMGSKKRIPAHDMQSCSSDSSGEDFVF